MDVIIHVHFINFQLSFICVKKDYREQVISDKLMEITARNRFSSLVHYAN